MANSTMYVNRKQKNDFFDWNSIQMNVNRKPREMTVEHYMTETLIRDISNRPNRPYLFKPHEEEFIRSLNLRFFNNPDYKLSERQHSWLTDLWEKKPDGQ